MSKEALRTQLDALQVDYQQFLAENVRLKDVRPGIVAGIEAEAEIAKITTQIGHLQAENAALGSTAEGGYKSLLRLWKINEQKSLN